MARKRFTAEQIIIKLREAEVGLAQGKPPESTASNGTTDKLLQLFDAQFRHQEGAQRKVAFVKRIVTYGLPNPGRFGYYLD